MKGLKTVFKHWLSLAGFLIFTTSFTISLFLFIVANVLGRGGLYMGLLTYIIGPATMASGMALLLIGLWVQRRRTKKGIEPPPPGVKILNLETPRQRRRLLLFTAAAALFVLISSLASFEAFHYTESVQFCGQLCHKIMEPEHVAYQHSSHARISCVECHVGAGADWFVRSKLSGLYQVYAALTKTYPTPIPTPIHNLRPARETCEHCHWPQKFYNHKMRFESYYLGDETNTRWDLQLVMRLGAEHSSRGQEKGIHWHINSDVRIEYISGEDKKNEIPWVRYTNIQTGESHVYRDEDIDFDERLVTEENIRVMDCIDCHNRPSHDYKSPNRIINDAFTSGEVSTDLPEFKLKAMELLTAEYESSTAAKTTIREGLVEFYVEDHPEFYAANAVLVEQAADLLVREFNRFFFPEMKVRWDTHNNQVGHMQFKGCARCHNNTHISDEGRRIGRDCNSCHVITAQGPYDGMETTSVMNPLVFRHPVDIDGAWQEVLCIECHEGSVY
ncbi:MAG: NapC/NirT family cytochrome c [Candidatus Aminicenantes bacterium]|nr:NapC/NirT family cytochrome c [Candidatus Aminicenantes bacterium]